MDGDTLTYRDLTEMYKLNMTNLYFRGVHEIISHKYDKYFKRNKFICAGVMMMNLELIRKNHFFNIFKKYYNNFHKKGILLGDQHIINAYNTLKQVDYDMTVFVVLNFIGIFFNCFGTGANKATNNNEN